MIHEMRLQAIPFYKIVRGEKSIELRLYDSKRRKVQIGDSIVFSHCHGEMTETVSVQVTALYPFSDFEKLFENLDHAACGESPLLSAKECASHMRKYYSAEDEKKYGVLGIGFSVIGEVNS